MASDPKDPKDPLVQAQVARALKPYLGVASPEMLATMAEELEEMFTTDPTATAMLEQIRKRAPPKVSHELPREGAGESDKRGGGKEGS